MSKRKPGAIDVCRSRTQKPHASQKPEAPFGAALAVWSVIGMVIGMVIGPATDARTVSFGSVETLRELLNRALFRCSQRRKTEEKKEGPSQHPRRGNARGSPLSGFETPATPPHEDDTL